MGIQKGRLDPDPPCAPPHTQGLFGGGFRRADPLPASDIFKQLLLGRRGPQKSCQDRHHENEWPVLSLTKLPKKQKRPWRKARSRPKVVGFDSSLHHTPSVSPIAKPSLAGTAVPPSLLSRCHGLFSGSLSFNSVSIASTPC